METVAYVPTERERHFKTVAIVQIVYASLKLMVGFVVALLLFGLSMLPAIEGACVSNVAILRFISYFALGVMIVTTLPGLIGGIGLLSRQPWARILLLVLSVFELISFPIGTAVGIYTLWALWEPIPQRRNG